MKTNFAFLQHNFPDIFEAVSKAEVHVFTSPDYAALLCRTALEKTLFWLYENDEDLTLPYDTTLAALMHADAFRHIIQPSIFTELNVIRKLGNNAAHGTKVSTYEALQSIKNTFRFMSWLSRMYSEDNPAIPAFDEALIPTGLEQDKTKKQLQALAEEFENQQIEQGKLLKQQQLLAEENERLKEQLEEQHRLIAERKEVRKQAYADQEMVPVLTPEAETRALLVDLMLKEAGWNDLKKGTGTEYPVTGMPLSTNPSGKGYVDYVLWDDNGKPLAVIETKQSLLNAEKGKHQAVLYADCLEKETGQRPIIFYSNGYKTHLWDDVVYPPREVFGFLTKDALQTLIRRRTKRKDLRHFEINTAIAGRPYQLQALKRVAENLVTTHQGRLVGRHRKALLVMATGSGKTRTAAALVDMLTKCDWAKRILFLADRNALVTQAKNAFKEYLPNLSTIDLTKEKDSATARVVFSTYPTIMNRIDAMKNNGERTFGVGHFDVIIIDEAHRSVYEKYQAIFAYFDAILIGLTATPKKDIDRNTYHLFEIEDDNPTFAYELNEAVAANYLRPPKALSVPVKFPREGVKYKDLSEKDKRHYEDLFGIGSFSEDQAGTEGIEKSKINTFLFNTNTVDIVLDYLMTNGQRIEGGDKLGKTIIFAKNHRHAQFIEERFNKNYPEYGGRFLQVIDNYNDKAQDLLERFCYDKGDEKDPQIAVSVDMMDTGVDAPRVLNLVFFKEVKSYAKFWQMIGRGTRLCPNIFGPWQDKEFFLIFDICGNLEFFEEFPDGHQAVTSKSLQQQLFEAKLAVAFTINTLPEANEADLSLAKTYIDDLHTSIKGLDQNRFEVRKHWEQVQKYSKQEAWDHLTNSAILEIQSHLSHLISYMEDRDEMAKKFDLLVYQLQGALLTGNKRQNALIKNLKYIAVLLGKKMNIPSVKQKQVLINQLQSSDLIQTIDIPYLENIRKELRGLVQFLKDDNQEKPVYSHLEDHLNLEEVKVMQVLESYTALTSYRDRVESFIRNNRHHLVIHKLYQNIPITPAELDMLETFFVHEKFEVSQIEKEYGTKSLGLFVRKVLGLDIEAANKHFAAFIQEESLTANQSMFVQKIIDYLNKNGVLEKEMLTQPPFTDQSDQGILGVFEDQSTAMRIVKLIDELDRNANLA